MTQRFLADMAWLGEEDLATSVLITAEDGVIVGVESGVDDADAVTLHGIALPGMVNAHSHAFHRALRGRTHQQGGDFWVWRDSMYEVAEGLTPESYRELAVEVYAEMLTSGFTAVGEFHYIHHQTGGQPYDDPNEMGLALIDAAKEVGIRIALLDAGYFSGGVGGAELTDVQRRFSDGDVESWLARVNDLAKRFEGHDSVRVGIAPHSVRALSEEQLAKLAELRDDSIRCHIHVSEQPAENQRTLEETGLTPVGLLDRSGLLGESTTAVHATHLTPEDIVALGSSGTGVCYCATTERELADGIGPAAELRTAGSPLSLGTDSHAVIDPFEEARGLELHHRLASGRRGEFAPTELLTAATTGGAQALDFESGGLVAGSPADFIVVSTTSPRTHDIAAIGGAGQVVFSATNADVDETYVAGRKVA